LDGRSIEEIVFPWIFVSLGLHERNGDFVPVTGEFLQNFKLTLSSLCYLKNDTGWISMTVSSPAFLEPTVEDGDFLTGSASFLAAKAGNVVFFPGRHCIVALLEPAEEDGDFFTGTGGFLELAANCFMGAAACLEPSKEDGDYFTGVLASLAAKAGNCNLVHRKGSFLGTNTREWRLLSRCASKIGISFAGCSNRVFCSTRSLGNLLVVIGLIHLIRERS
jgi:hypothetical protein